MAALGSSGRAGIWRIRKATVAAVIPMFPGISAYTAMISAVKIGHFGYSEALMITLLTNFLKASSIVGALSIGLSVPGLWLYRKRPRV